MCPQNSGKLTTEHPVNRCAAIAILPRATLSLKWWDRAVFRHYPTNPRVQRAAKGGRGLCV